MKEYKKWIAFMMAGLALLLFAPIETADAYPGPDPHEEVLEEVVVTLTWHGYNPTPIDIIIGKNVSGGYYTAEILEGDAINVMPETYLGNGKWQTTVSLKYSNPGRDGAPFIAISKSKLEGLWYCDKWAWNNVIYQPGAYGTKINDNEAQYTYFTGDFLLTSSAATNNSITVNRSWASGTPAADTTVNLYRYYNISGVCDGYKLIESKSLSASASSVSFNGLYGGNYAVTQTLPSYYSDDSSDTFAYLVKTGKPAVLSSATAASVSFTNTYTPPAKHAVNVATLTGGSITANTTQAIAGDTVTLTVTPDTDMQLKSGTLKYNDGTSDHYISGTSFTMPASAVTISAEFEDKQYSINVGTLMGGSITPDKAQAAAGDTVTLTITPVDGKKLKDNSLTITYGSTTQTISGTSFTMPRGDVTISGTFEIPVSIVTASLPEGMQGCAVQCNADCTGRNNGLYLERRRLARRDFA